MSRLTKQQRLQIANQMVGEATDKKIHVCLKSLDKMKDKVESELAKHPIIKKMRALPKGCVRGDSYFHVYHKGVDVKYIGSTEELFPDNCNTVDYLPEKFGDKLAEKTKEYRYLISARDDLYSEIKRKLAEFKTVSQLKDRWPQAYVAYEKSCNHVGCVSMQVNIEEVNEKLKNFPKDPAKEAEEKRKQKMRDEAKKKIKEARK